MYEFCIACSLIGMFILGVRGTYWRYRYNLLLKTKYPEKVDEFWMPNFFQKGFAALRRLRSAQILGDEELNKTAGKCYISYILGLICALLLIVFIFVRF
jgi:hypothetical protein